MCITIKFEINVVFRPIMKAIPTKFGEVSYLAAVNIKHVSVEEYTSLYTRFDYAKKVFSERMVLRHNSYRVLQPLGRRILAVKA